MPAATPILYGIGGKPATRCGSKSVHDHQSRGRNGFKSIFPPTLQKPDQRIEHHRWNEHQLFRRPFGRHLDVQNLLVKVDTDFFRHMSIDFAEQINDIQKEIFKEAGMEFNMNSPQQLGFILFEKLQLPVQRKTMKTKSYSTDVKVLMKLASSGFNITFRIWIIKKLDFNL